jgi:hypothetical protein
VRLSKNEDKILFLNSYDGTFAFRFYLISGGINIPVGELERVIHKGTGAAELDEEFKIHPDEIGKAVERAKLVANNIRNLKITDSLKKEILEIVFEPVTRTKNFESYELTIADSFDTIQKYVDTVIDRYIKGEYFIVKTDGKVRKGRKITSKFREMVVKNKVFDAIVKNHPALAI